MDPEQRLELIELLAADKGWDVLVLIGRTILDRSYPFFDGSSGDAGPEYLVALRKALDRIDRVTKVGG